MQPVHFIFAKHPAPGLKMRIRSAEFAKRRFAELVGGTERRVHLVMEEIYHTPYYVKSDIRQRPDLIRALVEETKSFVRILSQVVEQLAEGKPLPDDVNIQFMREILAVNSITPRKVVPHFSQFDLECQLLTLEAQAIRNTAYWIEMEGAPTELVVMGLMESITAYVRAVHRRDAMLLRQVREIEGVNTDALIIVNHGSNHRYLVDGMEHGLRIKMHVDPTETFPYYDEALRYVLEGGTDPERIVRLLSRDVPYNSRFMALVKSGAGGFVEDVIVKLRAETEARFGRL